MTVKTVDEPVRPVGAATVILTRPSRDPQHAWECYMIRRPVGSDFAADVYVFPGGKVDPQDADPDLQSVTFGHPGVEIGQPEEHIAWRALRVAAIRELFEEVAVLIAQRADGMLRFDGALAERFAAYRHEVHGGTLTMRALAEREGLIYPMDRLHPIARWVTPEPLPRRFDTVFFVTELPEGQEPQAHVRETTEGLWIAPAEALSRFRQGIFPLVFATEKNLETLASHASVADLIASTSLSVLDPVLPRMVQDVRGTRFLLPGDPEY